MRAVTRWALRFGTVLVSQPTDTEDGPKVYHRADFEFYGIKVTVYTLIPAATAST